MVLSTPDGKVVDGKFYEGKYFSSRNDLSMKTHHSPSHSFTETPEKLKTMATDNVKKAVEYRSQVKEMRQLNYGPSRVFLLHFLTFSHPQYRVNKHSNQKVVKRCAAKIMTNHSYGEEGLLEWYINIRVDHRLVREQTTRIVLALNQKNTLPFLPRMLFIEGWTAEGALAAGILYLTAQSSCTSKTPG